MFHFPLYANVHFLRRSTTLLPVRAFRIASSTIYSPKMEPAYGTFTHEQLVARIQELEQRLKSSDSATVARNKKKEPKDKFAFAKCHQRHIALKFLYLGWDFHGMAWQDNADNTIEGELIRALKRTCLIESRETCAFQRCGRTDKGVSALSQVVSLRVRTQLSDCPYMVRSEQGPAHGKETELQYVRMLNAVLPPEIRVVAWAAVPPEFEARFSCSSRMYKYYFVRRNLNIEAMRDAARRLQGEHDYRNFCKMDINNGVTNYSRRIMSFTVDPQPGIREDDVHGMWEFTIHGTAFLWHQVRCMVAVLFLVGEGRESPEVCALDMFVTVQKIIDKLLDVHSTPNKPQYLMASEVPLVLYDCRFEDVNWIYEADTHERMMQEMDRQWEGHVMRAHIIRRMMDSLDDRPVLVPQAYKDKYGMVVDALPWSSLDPLAAEIAAEQDAAKYKPLMGRKLEESFDERIANMSGKKRQKLESIGVDLSRGSLKKAKLDESKT